MKLRAIDKVVTQEDREWQDRAERLSREALYDLRTVAGRWAMTIGTLTGVLGLVAFVSGPRAIDQLVIGWRIGVGISLLVTVICAGWATWCAASASQGTVLTTLSTYARLREDFRREEQSARKALNRSKALTLVSGFALLLAVGLSWYGPKLREEVLIVENRPALSVDRNTIEAWNENWVQAKLRDGAHILPDLPNLDFLWLHQMSGDNPAIMQDLCAELMRKDAILPAWREKFPVNVRQVGIWPPDAELIVNSLKDRYVASRHYYALSSWYRRPISSAMDPYSLGIVRDSLEASRTIAWSDAGLPTDPGNRTYDRFHEWPSPTSIAGHPVPEPLDSALLMRDEHDMSMDSKLAYVSDMTGIGMLNLSRRLRRFVIFEADVPPVPSDPVDDHIADAMDIALLKSVDHFSYYRESSSLALAGTISYEFQQPIDVVLDRLNFLSVFNEDVGAMRDSAQEMVAAMRESGKLEYICTEHDASLFSRLRGGWLNALFDNQTDLDFALDLLQATNQSAARLIPTVREMREDGILAALLSKNFDAKNPWLKGKIHLAHLIAGCQLAPKLSPRLVAQLLSPHQELVGFELPADLSALDDVSPSRAEATFVGAITRICQLGEDAWL